MKITSLFRCGVCVVILALILAGCGSGGGGGSAGGPSSPAVVKTVVKMDPTVPPVAATAVDKVFSPFAQALPGQTAGIDVIQRESLLVAMDVDDEILLAAYADSSETQLSATSTAKAFARLAFGPLPPGIGWDNFSMMIASTAGFPSLVAEINAALAASIPPSASPQVINAVVAVANELGPLAAAFTPSARASQLISQPTASLPYPIHLIDLTSTLGLHISVIGSDVNEVRVTNGLPVAWTVVGGDNKDVLMPGNTVNAVLLGKVNDWLALTPVSVPTGGRSFDLVVKQTNESHIETASDLAARMSELALSVGPLQCSESELKAVLKPLLEADLAVPTWPTVQNYIGSTPFLTKVLPEVVKGCVSATLKDPLLKAIGDANKAASAASTVPPPPKAAKGFVIGAFKFMGKLYSAFQAVGTGATLGTQWALVGDFWDEEPHRTGICISPLGITNCAETFTFEPPVIYTIVGAKPSPTLKAWAPGPKETLPPKIIDYTANIGGILSLNPFNGEITALDLGLAAITATDPTTGVSGGYGVLVTDPVITPSLTTISVGESIDLTLTTPQGDPITTTGAAGNWYVDPAQVPLAVRTTALQVPTLPPEPTIGILGIAEGFADVVFFNQMTEKETRAVIRVNPAQVPAVSTVKAWGICDYYDPYINIDILGGGESFNHFSAWTAGSQCFPTTFLPMRDFGESQNLLLKTNTTYTVALTNRWLISPTEEYPSWHLTVDPPYKVRFFDLVDFEIQPNGDISIIAGQLGGTSSLKMVVEYAP